jgi:acetyl esterase/lipase
MTPGDLQALPRRPPTHRESYGTDASQHGELRLPSRPGPHPVAVLIHGGCFKAAYADSRDLAPMGDTLAAEGIATWNVEYRRVGHDGGGWPGTYLDVGRAVDHLRVLAGEHDLDLSRVVVVGHSAGGHLAMWTAARSRLSPASPLYTPDPLPIRGVVNLAGPMDLTANITGYQTLCRDSVITQLMGGAPATVPDRYAQASAISQLPLGVPQVVVIGDHEDFVPRPVADAYVRAATAAGDSIRMLVLPRTGHFEIAMPTTAAWAPIAAAIRSLLDGKLPPG